MRYSFVARKSAPPKCLSQGQAQVRQQILGCGVERRIVIALHAGSIVDLFTTAGQPRPEHAPVRIRDPVVGAPMQPDGDNHTALARGKAWKQQIGRVDAGGLSDPEQTASPIRCRLCL